MTTIQVEIVSAEGHIWSGEANLVIAPARMGEVGIAPRHAPLMTSLKAGDLRVQREGQEELFFYITGGILEVQPSRVTVLADTALRAEQLDESAADEARRQAEEALKGATDKQDLAHAQKPPPAIAQRRS
jgi:F-type H+-transporting ATPase subunit epsilon